MIRLSIGLEWGQKRKTKKIKGPETKSYENRLKEIVVTTKTGDEGMSVLDYRRLVCKHI